MLMVTGYSGTVISNKLKVRCLNITVFWNGTLFLERYHGFSGHATCIF